MLVLWGKMTECLRCSIEQATNILEFNGDELCNECYEWATKRLQKLKTRK